MCLSAYLVGFVGTAFWSVAQARRATAYKVLYRVKKLLFATVCMSPLACAQVPVRSVAQLDDIRFVDGRQFPTLAAALASLPASGGIVIDTMPETYIANPFAAQIAGTAGPALVWFGQGVWTLKTQIVIPDYSQIKGSGRENQAENAGTTFIADASFPASTAMFRMGAGTAGVADSGVRIEDLGIDCAGVAGCQGIYSSSINENCGVYRVVITRNMSHGILIDMAGGSNTAGDFSMDDIEIFPSATSTSVHGIYLRGLSTYNGGGVKLISNITVNGIGATKAGDGVRAENISLGTFIGLHSEKMTSAFHCSATGGLSSADLSVDNVVGGATGNGPSVVVLDAGCADIDLRNVQRGYLTDFANTIQDSASNPPVTLRGVLHNAVNTTGYYHLGTALFKGGLPINIAAITLNLGGSALSVGCTSFPPVTVPGASGTMACLMSGANDSLPTNIQPQCYVSSPNAVTPQLCTAIKTTPTSQQYQIRVFP
jgi:hypothetical protein